MIEIMEIMVMIKVMGDNGNDKDNGDDNYKIWVMTI